MNTQSTQKQLEARYPYMFAGNHIGISIPRGWIAIFCRLCADIDELLGSDKHGFHWSQCKEKFGAARWYWSMTGVNSPLRIDLIAPDQVLSLASAPKSRKAQHDALVSALSKLVDAAEELTTRSCIVCGNHGKSDRGNGWYLVLCPEHTQMRAQGSLPPIWFSEDDE